MTASQCETWTGRPHTSWAMSLPAEGAGTMTLKLRAVCAGSGHYYDGSVTRGEGQLLGWEGKSEGNGEGAGAAALLFTPE